MQEALAREGQPGTVGVCAEISSAKAKLLSPETYRSLSEYPTAGAITAIWQEYERELAESNAFDFDDLLLHGVRLLLERPAIAVWLRCTRRWLFVEEYQDSNQVQVTLASLLAGPQGNVTVVGDDDQCLTAGTRITMSDRSLKPIEQIPTRRLGALGSRGR